MDHRDLTAQCFTARPTHQLDPAELAENRLRRSGFPALQQITCEYCAGVLTLRGHLSRYYLKEVALNVVARPEGVQRIDNQIEVAARA
jgi:hypothetical protein